MNITEIEAQTILDLLQVLWGESLSRLGDFELLERIFNEFPNLVDQRDQFLRLWDSYLSDFSKVNNRR